VIDSYKIIQRSNPNHFFVARNGNKIVGFVIGYHDTNKVSKEFKKNIFRFGIKFLKGEYKITMPFSELFITGINSFRYISRPQGGGELLSMAVLQNFQGQAIGSKLVSALDESFKGLIKEYYVYTHTYLTLTVAFYLKLGLQKFSESKDGQIIILKRNLQ
jgi:ribosomal protein S18 acetylase RimI-like enzyme